MSKSRIAICLYKQEMLHFDVKTFFAGSLSKISLKVNNPNIYLYQRKSDPQAAPWVDFVKQFGNIRPSESQTASAGAILVVKIRNRYFGCCFGTSVANVNRDSIEQDFGLAAAYGRMSRTDVKAVESFSLSSNPITNQRISTLPTQRENFSIDSLSENITELEGYYRQGTNRMLIKGKEFYSCPIVDSLDVLLSLCGQLLLDYQNAKLRQDFLRLTISKKVKDKTLLAVLNDELCDRVHKRDSIVFLNDYEHLPAIAAYKLMDGSVVSELSLSAVLDAYKPKKPIDLHLLKENRIIPYDESGNVLSNWSLFKALFVELDSGESKYILFKSKWYEIDSSYLSNLQGFLDNYHLARGNRFPKWNGTESENTYNAKLAAKVGGQLWDQVLFTHADYNYGIEFCDVLSEDYIIAVKKYKTSALNSHLLMQTLVAMQLADADDVSFFEWIESVATNQFGGTNHIGINMNQLKQTKSIVLLLLAGEDRKASEILPFFSLVAFRLTIARLTNMGLNVRVTVV